MECKLIKTFFSCFPKNSKVQKQVYTKRKKKTELSSFIGTNSFVKGGKKVDDIYVVVRVNPPWLTRKHLALLLLYRYGFLPCVHVAHIYPVSDFPPPG